VVMGCNGVNLPFRKEPPSVFPSVLPGCLRSSFLASLCLATPREDQEKSFAPRAFSSSLSLSLSLPLSFSFVRNFVRLGPIYPPPRVGFSTLNEGAQRNATATAGKTRDESGTRSQDESSCMIIRDATTAPSGRPAENHPSTVVEIV